VFENKEKFLLMVFVLIVTISGYDIISDLSHGTSYSHVFQEIVLLTLSFLALLWLLAGFRKQQVEIKDLKNSLQKSENSQQQPAQYVLDARKRLADVIGQQFSDWSLSRSEQEVGWLLLKGLSLKEIANLRDTKEKTVRQQASAIYKKAGVNGRHTFSAWFIEDIL